MVKFKYLENRIGGIETVKSFINSSLIYFVHPKQLFLLGGDYREKLNAHTESAADSKSVISRLKRIFN